MSINSELLDLLVCPDTQQPLRPMAQEEVKALNERIRAGRVVNMAGQAVDSELGEALVCVDQSRAYPVREGIPVLLVEEAISLEASS